MGAKWTDSQLGFRFWEEGAMTQRKLENALNCGYKRGQVAVRAYSTLSPMIKKGKEFP